MSDTTIEDLDELNDSNPFDPLTDYIIVQRAGGDTYKMLLSQLTTGGVLGSTRYLDNKEFLISSKSQSGARFTFQQNGLFNYNSSFILELSWGDLKTSFIKTAASNAINGTLGLIPSIRTSEKIMSNLQYEIYADVNYDNSTHEITFSDIRYVVNRSSSDFIILDLAGAQNQFTASIQADISSS